MKRLLLAAVIVAAAGCRRNLPRLGQVPDFGPGGSGLAGRPWIADFVYTTCAGPCPALSAKMARLQKSLPASVALVSFTVDPKRDTPKVLAEYGRRFGAEPARWRFVRLEEAALARLMRDGFRLALASGAGAVVHSTKFVLVDGSGQVRGYYDGDDEASLKRLDGDAAALASGA